MKDAEAVMREADRDGDALAAHLGRALAEDRRMAEAEGLGKIISAGSMFGWGEDRIERMARAAVGIPDLGMLCAGRMPEANQVIRRAGKLSGPTAGFEWDAKALAQEARAKERLAPALIRGVSDRLERERQRRMEAGEGEERALLGALERVGNLLTDVADVAGNSPIGFWGLLEGKDPLGHGLRLHREWQERERREGLRRSGNMGKSWEGLLEGPVRAGSVEIEEITTGEGLYEEGEAMSHCVASYAEHCEKGRSRIFSARIGGVRAATVELGAEDARGERIEEVDLEKAAGARKAARWRVFQNRGKHNAQVGGEEMERALEALERAANERHRERVARLEEAEAEAEAREPKGEAVARRLRERREADPGERKARAGAPGAEG